MASNADTSGSSTGEVVICGGGIIGAATAFYLSRLGVAATVVEPVGVACAASGKAGGFLALDWNDTSAVGPLSRASFRLHEQLAQEFGADSIGYRCVATLQVSGAARNSGGAARRGSAPPAWVDGAVLACSEMGSPATTAQVHPGKLTHALLDAALARGVRLVCASAAGLTWRPPGSSDGNNPERGGGGGDGSAGPAVAGVLLDDGTLLPASAVVLAMGPWSDLARAWLPFPRVSGQKYHSVVLQPPQGAGVDHHMLFTSFRAADGSSAEPEVYPRPDGTVYVCGEPQALPVPQSAADVEVEAVRCQRIQEVAGAFASSLRAAPVLARQACYLPLSSDGLPVIGRLPGRRGCYVATGHSCWGILNGPATGLALARLITTGESGDVDLSPFSPARLLGELSQPLHAVGGARSGRS